MAIRTSLLTTRNINLDTDFSKYIETVSEPGVIEGFALANSNIGLGKARVPCERTNGETIYALVQNFNEVSISGNGYVIISISQTIIDDGSLGNEDGTGIATVEVVQSLPSKNYLELYEISELGLITDKRNMIKKVGELNTAIETLSAQVSDLDERVDALEAAGAIDHLEEQGLVGELYTVEDKMFRQFTSNLSDCVVEDCKVGNTNDNKEIHIQRIASGQASNTLKLKVKAVGSPTTALKVEVRSGIQVTVTENSEAYWYGDDEDILATGSIVYSDITTSWQEIEVELDNAIGGNRGDLLSIVCYQESSGSVVVNADNYYILACDSVQWSEAFSYVSVNGTTRTRNKIIPYCVGDGFEQSLLCKLNGSYTQTVNTVVLSDSTERTNYTYTYIATNSGTIDITYQVSYRGNGGYQSEDAFRTRVEVDGKIVGYNANPTINSGYTSKSFVNVAVNAGSEVKLVCPYDSGSSSYWRANDSKNVVFTYKKVLYNKTGVNLVVYEEKNLGEELSAISFGRLKDGSWLSQKGQGKQVYHNMKTSGTNTGLSYYTIPYDGYLNINVTSTSGYDYIWCEMYINGKRFLKQDGTANLTLNNVYVRGGDIIGYGKFTSGSTSFVNYIDISIDYDSY